MQGIESALSTSLITRLGFTELRNVCCHEELEQGIILLLQFSDTLGSCLKAYLLCSPSPTARNAQCLTLWLGVQKIRANLAASEVWGVQHQGFHTKSSE